jgi:hypothetical protein
MKSPYCQWLTDLSELAKNENVIIEAKYHDGLDFFFQSSLSVQDALPRYKDLVRRVIAINDEVIIPEAIQFADWLNNNWLIPAEDSFWKLDVNNEEYKNSLKIEDEETVYSAEELFEIFKNTAFNPQPK